MPWAGVHDLIERARAGDSAAWVDLHTLAEDYLLSLARRKLRNGSPELTAHDLTQDVWIQFHKNIRSFRGGANDEQTGAMLRAWLANTLTRLAKNYLRFQTAANRSPPGGRIKSLTLRATDSTSGDFAEPQAADPPPSHAAWQNERKSQMEHNIEALADPLDRAVIRHFFFECRTLKQIAIELNETYDRIRYRFNRALAQLGDTLKEPL